MWLKLEVLYVYRPVTLFKITLNFVLCQSCGFNLVYWFRIILINYFIFSPSSKCGNTFSMVDTLSFDYFSL